MILQRNYMKCGSSVRVFQASFPVKYRSMKDKNDWITQGTKNLVANAEEVCMPSLRTAMIQ
jgi:hypothetical protein